MFQVLQKNKNRHQWVGGHSPILRPWIRHCLAPYTNQNTGTNRKLRSADASVVWETNFGMESFETIDENVQDERVLP